MCVVIWEYCYIMYYYDLALVALLVQVACQMFLCEKSCRSSRIVRSEGKSKMGCLGISKRWENSFTFNRISIAVSEIAGSWFDALFSYFQLLLALCSSVMKSLQVICILCNLSITWDHRVTVTQSQCHIIVI